MSEFREPLVFLVGAGPGNPGFLTLRAVEVLGQADLVIYDKLVPKRLLDFAQPKAERVCVNDLPGVHPDRWPHIHRVMIEGAKAGKRIVRLKGGDPFVFGRGGEEAEALREADVVYEIVPGVTSGLAAAVCSGIPVTHRNFSSAVALVTGHENPTKPDTSLDWSALAKFPGTLVIYMGISRLPLIVETLLRNGKDGNTPAAVIHWATTGDQQALQSTLQELPGDVLSAGLAAPSIIVIGEVVKLRPQLQWFENRPLFGKRVLVTRPEKQAADFVRRLEQLGAVTFSLPTVEIREPADWAPVDRALANLSNYQWLVFTSVNGVDALIGRLRTLGRDIRALGSIKLAAIGPATADALRRYFLEPDLIPEVFASEGLARALKERAAGQRILLARADRGRDLLRVELSDVATVDQVAVYSQVDAAATSSEALDCLRRGEIDFVTLTSSNIAKSLIAALDEPSRARIRAGEIKLVSISPVTSAAVKELGLPVAAEATKYTTAGIIDALLKIAD